MSEAHQEALSILQSGGESALENLVAKLRRQPIRAIPLIGGGAAQVVISAPCMYVGFALDNSANVLGDAIQFYDGLDNKGRLIFTATIGATDFENSILVSEGIFCETGLYVSNTRGALAGAYFARWIGPRERYGNR